METVFKYREGEKMYFDHAATTPLHPSVLATMTEMMQTTFGNPSSVHQYGRQAHEKLENARQVIAASLQAAPHEIIFNGGGSEGDNTALLMTALARKEQGKHIITTNVEHHAILHTAQFLATQGFDVTYLPVDETGMVSVEAVRQALREDTILVSIMFANNETGNLFPIQAIGELLKDHPAYFHTDAVQAYGKVPIVPSEFGIDLLSVSAHKFNGPKGVGFLYKREGIHLPSFIHGGEQEEKRRAGTEDVVGIFGMAQAISILDEATQQAHSAHYQALGERFLHALEESQQSYQINGNLAFKLPHVLNVAFPGIDNQLLLMHLDLAGMAISTGSACTAGNVEPSHVLTAMYGEASPFITSSIRLSFGLGNTMDEVDQLAQKVIQTLNRLRK